MKTVLNRETIPSWLKAFFVMSIICFILLYFAETQIPTVNTSSGIIAILSAFVGIVGTLIVTSIQLKTQTNTESQKDKDVKIFQDKLDVYSEFIGNMWDMIDGIQGKDKEISAEKLRELRKICFRKLIFHLDKEQIHNIHLQIKSIDLSDDDTAMDAVGEITNILKSSIKEDKKNKKNEVVNKNDLIILFNSFVGSEKQPEQNEAKSQLESQPINENKVVEFPMEDGRTYWHFNAWGNEQIEVFKHDNCFLSLIEYGENWRTEQLKQVKPNDIVFLFKRGGTGYIGAFRVLNPPYKVIEAKESYNDTDKEDIEKYDIYNAIADGATLVSCILVEPIAYNYKGVGAWSIRRRTIERINDPVAVKYLVKHFNDEKFDYPNFKDEYDFSKDSVGKLDGNTEIKNIDTKCFNDIVEKWG